MNISDYSPEGLEALNDLVDSFFDASIDKHLDAMDNCIIIIDEIHHSYVENDLYERITA